jgi:aspartyl-tRNA synthetase
LEYKEISKKLNRKPKQISARLNQLGRSKIHCYDLVINGYTVASGTIKEIAGQLNANLYTVKRWRTDGVSWAEFIKLDQ